MQGEKLRVERVEHDKVEEGCFAAEEKRMWGLRNGLICESMLIWH